MFDVRRLDAVWTQALREGGKRAFEAIEPELERIMREVYVSLLGGSQSDVTEDQINRGVTKFRNVLVGNFSEEYLETQRKTTKALISKGIGYVDYVLAYVIYLREGSGCLTKAALDRRVFDAEAYSALYLGLQCDMSVSIDSYFKELETSNRLEREHFITSKANDIGQAVHTISSISTQTKMLSLNASIEASRAGDAGRGFAVLASEIKRMADDTNAAAGEIQTLAESFRLQSQADTPDAA